jgi:hypothetical protein
MAGRLLKAADSGAGGMQEEGPLNLRQFMPQAAELARQRQLSQRGPRHDISTMRTALRLGRQVVYLFAKSHSCALSCCFMHPPVTVLWVSGIHVKGF